MSEILRPATIEDAEIILEWRNDEETRHNSFSKDRIDLETHKKWFKSKLEDRNCFLFMMEMDGERVGQIRLDRVDDVGEISYTIAPDMRGHGFGKRILSLIEENVPEGICVIMGMVEEHNIASKKCFMSNGFAEFFGGGISCFIKNIAK